GLVHAQLGYFFVEAAEVGGILQFGSESNTFYRDAMGPFCEYNFFPLFNALPYAGGAFLVGKTRGDLDPDIVKIIESYAGLKFRATFGVALISEIRAQIADKTVFGEDHPKKTNTSMNFGFRVFF